MADTGEQAEIMTRIHQSGPIRALAKLHQHMVKRSRPYRLVVIGSTSSYKIRPQETIYCTVKAAKVAFTRNFAAELFRELPGSQVTMVNPGGMRTEFFAGTDIDASKLMDPRVIAGIIWSRVADQAQSYDEFNIERGPDSEPIIVDGARMPESPA